MGYLTPGKMFENMLQLKRFGLYYERILKQIRDRIPAQAKF